MYGANDECMKIELLNNETKLLKKWNGINKNV